jgi:hypothetical protein
MKQLNKRIAHLEMPDRFKGLQISDEGYPIPYFVGWVDGKPDFRLADPESWRSAIGTAAAGYAANRSANSWLS